MPKAVVFGCAGHRLEAAERRFFAGADPWGFILFARNVGNPNQLRALTASLRDSVGRQAPVLVDQEGGRVARLRAPHWREWPPVGETVARAAGDEDVLLEMLALRYRLVAEELAELGIDVNCAPVLDLPVPGAHEVIGDRALGTEAASVAGRGRAVCEALLAGGVLPVIKHLPGHGRARCDSHAGLPVVDTPLAELVETDFVPFRSLADMPLAMTAHVAYSEIDAEHPATLSSRVMGEVVREEIGFRGAVLSDDICMGALTGTPSGRASLALAAGCDVVLHCSGDLEDMQATMDGIGGLDGASGERIQRAEAARRTPEPWDAAAGRQRLQGLEEGLRHG